VSRAAAAVLPAADQVLDLIAHRLARALRERLRYRYVHPRVTLQGDGYRIQSPCCSRNVDPAGGLIDIALLVPQAGLRWSLCARDHASGTWVERFGNQPLDTLLEVLCVDSDRQFWP